MAEQLKKETKFKTYWYNRKLPYWFRKDRDRAAGVNDGPEVFRMVPPYPGPLCCTPTLMLDRPPEDARLMFEARLSHS